MRTLRYVAALAFLAAFAAPLSAQHAQTRQGFWIGFGVGAGSADISCDGCDVDRETSWSGHFRLGGTLRPNLLLGAESDGWTRDDDGVQTTIGFLSGVAYFYPTATNGLWLKGGLGIATFEATDDIDEITTTGIGLSAGVGYDFRMTPNFSLTPYLSLLQQVSGEAEVNGLDTGESAKVNVIQLGLGFTWQ